MGEIALSQPALAAVMKMQQNERTESEIYRRIAARTKSERNREVLLRLSAEEAAHYEVWKRYTGRELKPQMGKVRWSVFLAKLFGFTFVVKRMENGEAAAQDKYAALRDESGKRRD